MRSPLEVALKRMDGFSVREIADRTLPCYKYVIGADGHRSLALCLLVDRRYLYLFPHEAKALRKVPSLKAKVAYLQGKMEHLRLLEVEPGTCRLVAPAAKAYA